MPALENRSIHLAASSHTPGDAWQCHIDLCLTGTAVPVLLNTRGEALIDLSSVVFTKSVLSYSSKEKIKILTHLPLLFSCFVLVLLWWCVFLLWWFGFVLGFLLFCCFPESFPHSQTAYSSTIPSLYWGISMLKYLSETLRPLQQHGEKTEGTVRLHTATGR